MYDTIIVPTDGSEQAARGVETGLDIAEQHDAKIVCVYVVDERRYGETPALSTSELVHVKQEDEGIEMLKNIADRGHERGLEVECECCHGLPWKKIVAVAQQRDADLIVMGRRGSTDDSWTPLGSVTDRVIQRADLPVQAV
ncbi:MAG: universal stress protein [Natronomonas sp.]